MGERLKPAVLKTVSPERGSGVRIPLPPPSKRIASGKLLRIAEYSDNQCCSGFVAAVFSALIERRSNQLWSRCYLNLKSLTNRGRFSETGGASLSCSP